MKNLLYIILIAVSLVSCSAEKMFSQGMDKIEKAIEKDPSLKIPKDTVYKTVYDTIPGVDGKDSIIRITETITEPCDFDLEEISKNLRKRSFRELRHIRKMSKDSMSNMRRMYKLETNRLQDSLNTVKKIAIELRKQVEVEANARIKVEKELTKQKKGNWFTRLLGRFWYIVLIIGIALGIVIKSYLPF